MAFLLKKWGIRNLFSWICIFDNLDMKDESCWHFQNSCINKNEYIK